MSGVGPAEWAADGRAYTGRMDAASLEALEFPAIAARLAAATETPFGAMLAAELTPSPDADEIVRRQALTAERFALLELAEEVELRGVGDVRDAVAYAERGSVLDPAVLRAVASAVDVARAARTAYASFAASSRP